jgi:hypothetical protein
MALARCILGKFLGVGCRCFPPPLDVPTFSARCLYVQRRKRPPAAQGGTLRGREMFRQILPKIRILLNSRDLLHAANLRHGTDGFTSSPKKGVLRIFSPLKIRRLWPGLNPQTWVPKSSTLTLILFRRVKNSSDSSCPRPVCSSISLFALISNVVTRRIFMKLHIEDFLRKFVE